MSNRPTILCLSAGDAVGNIRMDLRERCMRLERLTVAQGKSDRCAKASRRRRLCRYRRSFSIGSDQFPVLLCIRRSVHDLSNSYGISQFNTDKA